MLILVFYKPNIKLVTHNGLYAANVLILKFKNPHAWILNQMGKIYSRRVSKFTNFCRISPSVDAQRNAVAFYFTLC